MGVLRRDPGEGALLGIVAMPESGRVIERDENGSNNLFPGVAVLSRSVKPMSRRDFRMAKKTQRFSGSCSASMW
jgi:hypothetical protein